MSQWVNGSVDGSMGRMGPGSMGQWVMGLGYDGSDGSWVTNGDPWSTLLQSCRGNGNSHWDFFPCVELPYESCGNFHPWEWE